MRRDIGTASHLFLRGIVTSTAPWLCDIRLGKSAFPAHFYRSGLCSAFQWDTIWVLENFAYQLLVLAARRIHQMYLIDVAGNHFETSGNCTRILPCSLTNVNWTLLSEQKCDLFRSSLRFSSTDLHSLNKFRFLLHFCLSFLGRHY